MPPNITRAKLMLPQRTNSSALQEHRLLQDSHNKLTESNNISNFLYENPISEEMDGDEPDYASD